MKAELIKLTAKAAVVGALALAAGLITCLASHLAGVALLGEGVAFGTALRGVGGTAVYLAGVAILGLGIGALLRQTAAALCTLFAVLWVPLIVVSLLPMQTGLQVAKWCPMFAGLAVSSSGHSADSLPISPGAGLALFCACAAAAFGAALWLVARRDA